MRALTEMVLPLPESPRFNFSDGYHTGVVCRGYTVEDDALLTRKSRNQQRIVFGHPKMNIL